MMTDVSLLNSVSAPVFAVQMQNAGRFLAWNDALVLASGIPAKSVLGRTPEDVFGPDGARLYQSGDARRTQIGGLGHVCLQRWGDVLVGTLNDKERETYLGMAAHDLRTPLRNIVFLAEEAMQDAGAHGYIAKIKQVARGAISLTHDVVSCAQATGMQKTRFTRVSLRPMCQSIFATLDVEARHILRCDDLVLQAEKPILQVVLRNLLDNAIRHGGGRALTLGIHVTAAAPGICIQVRDNGKGFQDPALNFLSGGEFRIESGYGLVTIRRLVRARGGSISVTQSEHTPGSAVNVTLPGYLIEQDRVAIAS